MFAAAPETLGFEVRRTLGRVRSRGVMLNEAERLEDVVMRLRG